MKPMTFWIFRHLALAVVEEVEAMSDGEWTVGVSASLYRLMGEVGSSCGADGMTEVSVSALDKLTLRDPLVLFSGESVRALDRLTLRDPLLNCICLVN